MSNKTALDDGESEEAVVIGQLKREMKAFAFRLAVVTALYYVIELYLKPPIALVVGVVAVVYTCQIATSIVRGRRLRRKRVEDTHPIS